MKKIVHFIKYNNFFTIIIACILLSSGVTLAATPGVQEGILSSKTTVRSVDNTYIASVDLSTYNSNLKVTNVTEDADNYYVDYSYSTIDVIDYVWRNVDLQKRLTVAKTVLGNQDLGLFVSKQLGEVIDSQMAYLKESQKIELAKGVTKKVVATEYSGLIGSFLSSDEKEFEGYNPVKPPDTATDTTMQTAAVADAGPRSQSIPASQQQAAAPAGNVDPNMVYAKETDIADIINSLANQNQPDPNQPPATTTDSSSGTGGSSGSTGSGTTGGDTSGTSSGSSGDTSGTSGSTGGAGTSGDASGTASGGATTGSTNGSSGGSSGDASGTGDTTSSNPSTIGGDSNPAPSTSSSSSSSSSSVAPPSDPSASTPPAATSPSDGTT